MSNIRVFADVRDAMVLLRLPNLRPGKVDSQNMRFSGVPKPIGQRRPLKIEFRGDVYKIEVKNSLVHSTEQGRTALLPVRIDEDSGAELMWAGDLDGDGKLDILVSSNDERNGRVCLYLSTSRKSGARLQPVACQCCQVDGWSHGRRLTWLVPVHFLTHGIAKRPNFWTTGGHWLSPSHSSHPQCSSCPPSRRDGL